MIQIRSMTKNDVPEILAQMRIFYDSPAISYPVNDQILKQTLRDCTEGCPYVEGLVFQDTEALTLAGYAILATGYSTEYGGVCIWVEDLYLQPAYRHQGIGTQFFTYLTERYQGKAVRLRLEVEPHNEHAIALYQKAGFEEVPYTEFAKEL